MSPGRQRIAFGLVFGLAGVAEIARWWNPSTRLEALTGWLAGTNADWLPFLVLIPLLPLLILGGGRSIRPSSTTWWQRWGDLSAGHSSSLQGAWLAAGSIFILAFVVSHQAGKEWSGFPPAYHDEFSYLFQAETYLQGRWWLPSAKQHPERFDQMHVLNEGHFASRYFPGVGFWLAPFVALGNPWLGYHLVQGLAAMLVFWIGRELSTNRTGLLAGVLFALSPGTILFSNLLLAHHPALAGLLLFLWLFLRWMRRGGNWMLFGAGTGLSYAMLCRPMTAAGFALPFGIVFAWWWLTGKESGIRLSTAASTPLKKRTRSAFVLAFPLIAGFVILGISNRSITGSWLKTPYQRYTDIYTPRHRYGFNNVIIGEHRVGPKVLDNYDRWAENLTPKLALKNVRVRLENSLRWTLGIVPISLAGAVCLLTFRQGDRRWRLVWLSIFCLHLVHIPYWFSGIMGWHYVFETAPLWLLIFAEGTNRLQKTWRSEGTRGLIWWWRLVTGMALCVNLVTIVPVWPGRLERGMAELAFSRERYHVFRQQIDELRDGKPAIVFVIPDPADRHLDYVTNPPTLDGPVLVARIHHRMELAEAAAEFPDRMPLVFDAKTREWSRLPETGQKTFP